MNVRSEANLKKGKEKKENTTNSLISICARSPGGCERSVITILQSTQSICYRPIATTRHFEEEKRGNKKRHNSLWLVDFQFQSKEIVATQLDTWLVAQRYSAGRMFCYP